MGIIQNIIEDYEKLINTRITIPLDSGDIIKFMFHAADLPHLLGLQYLVDIPELFEYSQSRLDAQKLYKRILPDWKAVPLSLQGTVVVFFNAPLHAGSSLGILSCQILNSCKSDTIFLVLNLSLTIVRIRTIVHWYGFVLRRWLWKFVSKLNL